MKTLILFTFSLLIAFTSFGQNQYYGKFNGNGATVTNLAGAMPPGTTTNVYAVIGGTLTTTLIPLANLPSGSATITTNYPGGLFSRTVVVTNSETILGTSGNAAATNILSIDANGLVHSDPLTGFPWGSAGSSLLPVHTNDVWNLTNSANTIAGNGTAITGLAPTNIASGQVGVGYIYNANNEVARTNNARDITILQKPSGAILYSNGVNAGVVSGASSVQVVVGFPNNPFWFGTNANWVLNGLANYTNGWSTSFALNTTNKNGSAITITHAGFTSVTSNGVDCASGVITIPGGHKAYGGGDVGPIDATSSATNIFWFIK